MVIFENKGYQTHSLYPNEDWTGKALYVVDDNSEIASKIKQLYPNYDFVVENGVLVDVIEVECAEPEETEQPNKTGKLTEEEYKHILATEQGGD